METIEIKERIKTYEEVENGLGKLGDIQVSVGNLRENEYDYVADIVFTEFDGNSKLSEVFKECDYPKDFIESRWWASWSLCLNPSRTQQS